MKFWRTKSLGERGERLAAKYLRGLGYKILARQFKSRFGELDIIALDGDTVVLVEVKTRSSDSAGQPVEAVTAAKQAQLTRLALAFLKQHHLLESRARFDVVAITWPEESSDPQVEHFINAFPAVGQGQMFS